MIKKKMNAFALLLIFLAGMTSPLQANPYADVPGVEDVHDKHYLTKIRELISSAQDSIDLSIERIAVTAETYDPVYLLIESLIDASKRGVRVRFFLNTFNDRAYDTALFLREDVLEKMRKHHVKVYFISPKQHLADRLVIVDKRAVLEGGPIWTKEGFESSLSSASVHYSAILAESKTKRLELLPLWNLKVKRENQTSGQLAVPVYLLKDMKYFPGMVKAEDGVAMKVYLTLLRKFYETQKAELFVDFDDLIRELPGDKYYENAAVAFQVSGALERLATQYELIQVSENNGMNAKVQMNLPPTLRPSVAMPLLLLDENYIKELTPEGIYVYLIILRRTQMSGEAPVWLGSESNIQQDFPIDSGNFRMGIMDLRRLNLVEVFPFYLNASQQEVTVQKPEYRYLVNDIATLSEKLATWDRIRDYYGDFSFQKAKGLAEMLGEPEDPKVVVTYIDLLQKFSIEDVRALTNHVKDLSERSTPEMLEYLSALLQNETRRNFQLATR